jgi:predicted TIM-barrel fold metal-dependent hydrolase
MENESFRKGFSKLSQFNLSFDAWLVHTQISELTSLARAFPDTVIIFDHFGGPLGIGSFSGRQKEIYPIWRKDVEELSKCENVYAKLGGLAMPLNGWGWDLREKPATSDEIVNYHKDYYSFIIDSFGPKRCMFESNFPVDKFSVSYNVLWNALKKIAMPFSADEKNQMFLNTAETIYKI